MGNLVNISESRRFASGTRTGTRAAADFTIDVGFTPTVIRVVNLTTRAEAEHIVETSLDGASNVKSLITVAAGTRTYADAGISVSNRSFSVVVATAALETTNADVYWEVYG